MGGRGEDRGLRPATGHQRVPTIASGPEPAQRHQEGGGWVRKATEAGDEQGPSLSQTSLGQESLGDCSPVAGGKFDLSEPQFLLWMARTLFTCPAHSFFSDQVKRKSRKGSFIFEPSCESANHDFTIYRVQSRGMPTADGSVLMPDLV